MAIAELESNITTSHFWHPSGMHMFFIRDPAGALTETAVVGDQDVISPGGKVQSHFTPAPQASGVAVEIDDSPFRVRNLEQQRIQSCPLDGDVQLFKGLGESIAKVLRKGFGIKDEAFLAAAHENGAQAKEAYGGQQIIHRRLGEQPVLFYRGSVNFVTLFYGSSRIGIPSFLQSRSLAGKRGKG